MHLHALNEGNLWPVIVFTDVTPQSDPFPWALVDGCRSLRSKTSTHSTARIENPGCKSIAMPTQTLPLIEAQREIIVAIKEPPQLKTSEQRNHAAEQIGRAHV